MIQTQRCCLCGDLADQEEDGEYFCTKHALSRDPGHGGFFVPPEWK